MRPTGEIEMLREENPLLSIWTALFLTSCEEHVKGSGVNLKIAERTCLLLTFCE